MNKYGLQGKRDASSAFAIDDVQHNLSSPTLNITTSYDDSSLKTLSGYLTDLATNGHTSELGFVQDISPSSSWVYQNETYSWEYVLDHASCRYSKYYDWGFSFLILFTTSLLLALWSVGTYALWLYVQVQHHKQHGHSDQGPFGIYSSTLTLARALRNDFGDDVLQPWMREADIRDLVRRRRNVGVTGIRDPKTLSTTTILKETAPGVELNLQASSRFKSPHSKASKNAWKSFKSLLRLRYPSAARSLPYQSTASSQAHVMHSSTGVSPMDTSSLASIMSPSTVFNYSATIPDSDPPSLGTGFTTPISRISPKAGRLGLGANNSADRSYSYSSTSSRSDPPASDRQTTAWQVSSTPADAAPFQGLSQISRPSSTRKAPGKGLAANVFEFRNDLGDD